MHREGILPILRLRTHVPVGLRSAFTLEFRLTRASAEVEAATPWSLLRG